MSFAVKVGGMRITQNKPVHEKPEPKVEAKDGENEEEEEAVQETTPKVVLSVSGAIARVRFI